MSDTASIHIYSESSIKACWKLNGTMSIKCITQGLVQPWFSVFSLPNPMLYLQCLPLNKESGENSLLFDYHTTLSLDLLIHTLKSGLHLSYLIFTYFIEMESQLCSLGCPGSCNIFFSAARVLVL